MQDDDRLILKGCPASLLRLIAGLLSDDHLKTIELTPEFELKDFLRPISSTKDISPEQKTIVNEDKIAEQIVKKKGDNDSDDNDDSDVVVAVEEEEDDDDEEKMTKSKSGF